MLTTEETAQHYQCIDQCIDTIASILLRQTSPEPLPALEGVEPAMRAPTQPTVLPQLGLF